MIVDVIILLTLLNSCSLQKINFHDASTSGIDWNFHSDPNSIFHAYVIEKKQEIFVHPPLHIQLHHGIKLCHVHLLPTATQPVPKFISTKVTDPNQGHATLVLNESALYAARLQGDKSIESGVFHLRVVAEDCSNPHQTTRPWAINVVLVPTEQPVWAEREYIFRVDANMSAGDIVGKVTAYAAFDLDTGRENRLGDDTGMCNYAIDHPDNSLFDINGHGVIRSRTVFQQSATQRYVFNVTGFDCHIPVPRRSTVQVTVIVQSHCKTEWKGFDPELVYTSLPRAHWVARNATLKACDSMKEGGPELQCKPIEASLRVKLLWSREDESGGQVDDAENDDGTDKESGLTNVKQKTGVSSLFACDLDVLSVRALAQSCGLLPNTIVELLPPSQETPTLFNGFTQYDVTPDRLPVKQHRLDNVPFTLSFWMRHTPRNQSAGAVNQDEANGREHIVCNSDEEEKNRHHFAVYVHNCKLTMLLRREPVNKQQHERIQLYPSQWRFSVDDVCDGQWHHYALSFRPPPPEVMQGLAVESNDWTMENQVKLLIDGDSVPIDADLVQITEDVPMHELHHHSNTTRMSLGACWHSRTARYVQHFTGELSAVMLSIGSVLSDELVQCMSNCYPRLHVTGPLKNAQLPELPPLHQSRLDNLIVQANHVTDLTDLMRHVIFFNPRLKLLPKSRPEPIGIHLSTRVKYPSHCENISVPDVTIRLVRLPITPAVEASLQSSDQTRSDNRNPVPILPPRMVPTHSLLLKFTKLRSDPISISSEALQRGIWLFPSVELSWTPLAQPENAKVVSMSDSVSYCDVDLCPAVPTDHEPLDFARKETITVSTDYMVSGLRIEQSEDGMRFRGPVKAGEIVKTLRHLKWFNLEHTPPEKRCFRLICVAEVEPKNAGGPHFFVQSNILQVMFNIQPVEKRVRPRIAKAVDRSHYFQTPSKRESNAYPPNKNILGAPHQDSVSLPKVDKLRELNDAPEETHTSDQSWGRSSHITYTLIGSTIAIVLIAIALGLVYFLRTKSSPKRTSMPSPRKRGWVPVPSVDGAPCPRQTKSTRLTAAGDRTVQLQHNTLEVILNPTTHQKEFEEMENKYCFYDRKKYDEEVDDVLDPDHPMFQDTIYDSELERAYRPYVGAEDPHEDVSDFDAPSERETDTSTPLPSKGNPTA